MFPSGHSLKILPFKSRIAFSPKGPDRVLRDLGSCVDKEAVFIKRSTLIAKKERNDRRALEPSRSLVTAVGGGDWERSTS